MEVFAAVGGLVGCLAGGIALIYAVRLDSGDHTGAKAVWLLLASILIALGVAGLVVWYFNLSDLVTRYPLGTGLITGLIALAIYVVDMRSTGIGLSVRSPLQVRDTHKEVEDPPPVLTPADRQRLDRIAAISAIWNGLEAESEDGSVERQPTVKIKPEDRDYIGLDFDGLQARMIQRTTDENEAFVDTLRGRWIRQHVGIFTDRRTTEDGVKIEYTSMPFLVSGTFRDLAEIDRVRGLRVQDQFLVEGRLTNLTGSGLQGRMELDECEFGGLVPRP